jgi:hypothetical protein
MRIHGECDGTETPPRTAVSKLQVSLHEVMQQRFWRDEATSFKSTENKTPSITNKF